MNQNLYYGNSQQIRGVEEYRLVEGKANGMRMMRIRNGLGLEVELTVDRCLDIARVIYKGDNLGYFSPCGNVSPMYYDANGSEMVRSFTGGFLTTCGLDNAGEACEVDGVTYPLHGRISNEPAEHCYWTETEEAFVVVATMRQAGLFLEKMELQREIRIGKNDTTISIHDTITNRGDQVTPCMIIYHMNMGYPLLSEKAELTILSKEVSPRNEYARKHMEKRNQIEVPGSLEGEVCYFHEFEDKGFARIYNSEIKKGVEISFDSEQLNCFTQWKMMGKYDYVLGLEPGNCFPNGRRQIGMEEKLVELAEEEHVEYVVDIKIVEE